jgi:tetratricopeptide (TPR) repeat protein
MNPCKATIAALATCSWLAMSAAAIAHDGPEHEIDELTARIKDEGESADLLLQRAIEWNVLNKSAEAIKDLERALHLDGHSAPILRELSRSYFSAGKTNEALETAGHGIKAAEAGAERASLHMVRCDILRARRDYQKALEDADKAITEHPDNTEWYLARSALQQQLGLKKERIKGLDDGFKETGSGLIEAEWLDALIDGGKADKALAKIEAELKDARLQSSWLIRRAKVRLAMKQKDEAKADLEAALTELNERLSHGKADPLLLADRGQTYELLGKTDDAKKDYESAREKGNRDEWIRERLRVFKEAEDKKKEAEKKKDAGKKKDDKATEKKDDSKEEKPSTDDPKDDKGDDKPDADK